MTRARAFIGALARRAGWTAPLIVALLSLVATLCALYSLTFAILGRDQGIFQYVAWALRHGERAYRDIHEINGPLPHAWHMLLQWLGGEDEHRFRTIDTIVLVSGYGVASITLPRWVGLDSGPRLRPLWFAAGIAVLGAQYVRFDWWHTTQREGLYAMLVLGSLAAQVVAHGTENLRHARIAFFFAGLLTALPWFGKPPCVTFALLQIAVLVFDRKSLKLPMRSAIVFGILGALVASAAMIAFVIRFGDLSAAVHMLSAVPLLHHTIWNESLVRCYHAYGNAPRIDWAIASVAAFLVAYRVLDLPRRALLGLVLPIGGFVVFIGQGKAFPYHLHMVTLGTSVIHLLLLAAVVRRAASRPEWAIGALVLSATLGIKCLEDARRNPNARSDWAELGRTAEQRQSRAYLDTFPWGDFFPGDLRDAASYLQTVTRDDDRIQTYGLDPYLLFLARRKSATPTIYDFELNVDAALKGGSGARPTPSQRESLLAYRDHAEHDVLEHVMNAPPAAFAFFDHAPFSYPENGEEDFRTHCPSVFAWMQSRYVRGPRFGTVRLWLRTDIEERSASIPTPP